MLSWRALALVQALLAFYHLALYSGERDLGAALIDADDFLETLRGDLLGRWAGIGVRCSRGAGYCGRRCDAGLGRWAGTHRSRGVGTKARRREQTCWAGQVGAGAGAGAVQQGSGLYQAG